MSEKIVVKKIAKKRVKKLEEEPIVFKRRTALIKKNPVSSLDSSVVSTGGGKTTLSSSTTAAIEKKKFKFKVKVKTRASEKFHGKKPAENVVAKQQNSQELAVSNNAKNDSQAEKLIGAKPKFVAKSEVQQAGKTLAPSLGGEAKKKAIQFKSRVNTSPLPAKPQQLSKDNSTLPEPFKSKKRSFKATRKKQFVNKKNKDTEKTLQFSSKPKVVQQVNPVPKSISIMENISAADLAKKMNLKVSQLLSKLMDMGVMVSVNSILDVDTVQLLASEYSCEVKIVTLYDQTIIETPKDLENDLQPRAPVVTIMGHVDHGKTTLLDNIRKTNIVQSEQGSITQHIGAYQIHTKEKDITFLDTPGHVAFSLMRARGAQLTDIVVLVVAVDDGIQDQTKEAIRHAKEAKVPIIVALNKMDLLDINVDKIFKELSEVELVPEEWGGDTIVCKISALKGEGIEDLLEHILLSADLLELKANPNSAASGRIIESKISHGHGIVATVLIERGTLHVKDSFVAGIYSGRAKLLLDDKGKPITKAGPSMPVEVIGLDGIPVAGDPFQITENEKIAKQISLRRQELSRHKFSESVRKITSATLYHSLEASSMSNYKVIIKGDVYGSVEAIKMALEGIGNDEVQVQVIFASAGSINESDVMLASASEAAIIGFNVRPSQKIQQLAAQERVLIYKFTVIFDIIDKMKEIISGMLSPDVKIEKIGEVEIREIFTMSKVGSIAGSYVVSGKVVSDAIVHVIRNNSKIAEDRIDSLKRFQDTVKSAGKGYECGISLKETNDLRAGDILYVFEEKEIARKV